MNPSHTSHIHSERMTHVTHCWNTEHQSISWGSLDESNCFSMCYGLFLLWRGPSALLFVWNLDSCAVPEGRAGQQDGGVRRRFGSSAVPIFDVHTSTERHRMQQVTHPHPHLSLLSGEVTALLWCTSRGQILGREVQYTWHTPRLWKNTTPWDICITYLVIFLDNIKIKWSSFA